MGSEMCIRDRGHTEPGAGLAGASKLLMILRSARSSPNAQLRALNPHVGERMHGYLGYTLPTQTSRWCTLCSPATGGVSSFGYAGTIAHAMLAAHPDGARTDVISTMLLPVMYRRHAFQWRSVPHPFAQRRLPGSDGSSAILRSPAAGALHALVANHAVQGRVLFPAAGYLEAARAAVGTGATLRLSLIHI